MLNRAVWKYALYLFHILLILGLMASGVYLISVSRPRIEKYAQNRLKKLLPPQLDYRRLDVHFFPLNLNIRGLSLKRTGDVSMRVGTLQLKPDLWKLAEGILQVHSLSLYSPSIHLYETSRGVDVEQAAALLNTVRRNLDETLRIPGVLSRVRLREATVHLYTKKRGSDPILTLDPLRFTMGPVHLAHDTGSLRFTLRSKMFEGRGSTRIDGTVLPDSGSLSLEGEIRAEKIAYRNLAPVLDLPPKRGGFQLTGELPFRLETDVLRLGETRLTLRNMRGEPFGSRSNGSLPSGVRALQTCEKMTLDLREGVFAVESSTRAPSLSLRNRWIRPLKLDLKALNLHEPRFLMSGGNVLRGMLDPDPPGSSRSTSVSIDRVSMRKASVRWSNSSPWIGRELLLEPLWLTVGPLRSGSSPDPIRFQLQTGWEPGTVHLRARGNVRPGRPASLDLRGTLALNDLRVSNLRRHFTAPLPLKSGQLSGTVPVTVRNRTLHLGRTVMSARHVRSAPRPSRKATQLIRRWSQNRPVASAPLPRFRLGSAKSIRLRIRDWKWSLNAAGPSAGIDIRDGRLEVERLTPDLSRARVRGKLRFNRPRAWFSLGGEATKHPPRKNHLRIWAHLDFPRLSELNPYLKRGRLLPFPFRIKGGQLRSRTRGVVSPGSLDLKTDLKFRELDLVQSRPDRAKVLNTSPTMFLWYLYHTGGSLDLKLRIDGSPLRPRFQRIEQ